MIRAACIGVVLVAGVAAAQKAPVHHGGLRCGTWVWGGRAGVVYFWRGCSTCPPADALLAQGEWDSDSGGWT